MAPPPAQFHPLLNGETVQEPLIHFDLSLDSFTPMRVTRAGNTHGTPLSVDELKQQATHPGVTRMTIVIDGIPQWPVRLSQSNNPTASYLSVPDQWSTALEQHTPITLGDILVALHRMLQMQVSHRDWVKLSQDESTVVARAYTRRCRTFGSEDRFLASQGVRRVDYLKDKYIFKGLVRMRGEDGFDQVRAVFRSRA